jgi:hypothetical protein
MTLFAPSNPMLLERLVPFAVATEAVHDRLDPSPFGQRISARHRFDSLRCESAQILERLRALDSACFGPGGMAMPRWILLDGAGLSGAIIGLATPAEQASASVRELLGLTPFDTGLIPYSMYIAIPSFESDTWVGHNLASLAVSRPEGEDLRGLGGLTKAIALRALGARRQLGAAQWDSVALRVHARLGPLRLLTAWTPAHTKPWTFTYAAEINEAHLRHLARDPTGRVPHLRPERWLRIDDHRAIRALQSEIEQGEDWYIAGPPELDHGRTASVPLARL